MEILRRTFEGIFVKMVKSESSERMFWIQRKDKRERLYVFFKKNLESEGF